MDRGGEKQFFPCVQKKHLRNTQPKGAAQLSRGPSPTSCWSPVQLDDFQNEDIKCLCGRKRYQQNNTSLRRTGVRAVGPEPQKREFSLLLPPVQMDGIRGSFPQQAKAQGRGTGKGHVQTNLSTGLRGPRNV